MPKASLFSPTRLGVLIALASLAACGSTVQTTSGAKYLAARPDFHPDANDGVQAMIYRAADVPPENSSAKTGPRT